MIEILGLVTLVLGLGIWVDVKRGEATLWIGNSRK